jgi:hypothetical protein
LKPGLAHQPGHPLAAMPLPAAAQLSVTLRLQRFSASMNG